MPSHHNERLQLCSEDWRLQEAMHQNKQAHGFITKDDGGFPDLHVHFIPPDEEIGFVAGELTEHGEYWGPLTPQWVEAEWHTTRSKIQALGQAALF